MQTFAFSCPIPAHDHPAGFIVFFTYVFFYIRQAGDVLILSRYGVAVFAFFHVRYVYICALERKMPGQRVVRD